MSGEKFFPKISFHLTPSIDPHRVRKMLFAIFILKVQFADIGLFRSICISMYFSQFFISHTMILECTFWFQIWVVYSFSLQSQFRLGMKNQKKCNPKQFWMIGNKTNKKQSCKRRRFSHFKFSYLIPVMFDIVGIQNVMSKVQCKFQNQSSSLQYFILWNRNVMSKVQCKFQNQSSSLQYFILWNRAVNFSHFRLAQ